MPYVITQRCCNDAACVPVCPVDCIRPRPDDPEFTTSDMLYIDPASCTDCGLCMEACPVSAIHHSTMLPDPLASFEDINAHYFRERPLVMRAPALPAGPVRDDLGPLRVAVIGSGAAACYAAEELLGRYPAQVDLFEKQLTPWGLVRSGVAPDHAETKTVTDEWFAVNEHPDVRLHFGVEVGTHVSMDELRSAYHAVIIAAGASEDRRLGIEGEDLPGSHPASEFVAWFNGHPDHADDVYDLSGERAVIVGNGNVALDIARVLVADVDYLATTDIADHALDALKRSNITEVVVLGRRGTAQAAYTIAEFVAMANVPGVEVVIDPADAEVDPVSAAQLADPATDPAVRMKVDEAARYAAAPGSGGGKRIVFRYLTSPDRILGDERVTGLAVTHNELVDDDGRITARPTGTTETIETGLVLRSVGYRGLGVPGAPFDERRGVVPNDAGRVTEDGQPVPGLYATGWIKRGPTGGIGSNKYDARDTVSGLLDDLRAQRLPQAATDAADFDTLLRDRCPEHLTRADWQAIDAAERARGSARGRPRVKFTTAAELAEAARTQ